jgi:hypothetical protein
MQTIIAIILWLVTICICGCKQDSRNFASYYGTSAAGTFSAYEPSSISQVNTAPSKESDASPIGPKHPVTKSAASNRFVRSTRGDIITPQGPIINMGDYMTPDGPIIHMGGGDYMTPSGPLINMGDGDYMAPQGTIINMGGGDYMTPDGPIIHMGGGDYMTPDGPVMIIE